MSRSSSTRRRLARTAAGVVLATGLGAAPLHADDPLDPFPVNAPIASQWSFATPWDAFFDTSREVGLFHLYDCIDFGVRLYATDATTPDCLGVRAERGYEAATGQGALRIMITERQVGAGVDGGPASVFPTTLTGRDASGGPGGIFFFALSGETVIRPTAGTLFQNSANLATLSAFTGGEVGHFHRFVEQPGVVWPSISSYNLAQVQSVMMPGAIASTTAPEPGTWMLLGTGLLALGGVTVRRKRRPA